MKISKLFFAFMALSLLLTLPACSGDDDDHSIVGTWTFAKATVDEVKTNSSENDVKVKSILEEDYLLYPDGQKITFSDDGKYVFSSEEDSENGTYSYKNGVLTLNSNWGVLDGVVTSKVNAIVEKGSLILSVDYATEFNEMDSGDLNWYKITDPNFSVSKATVKVIYTR